MSEPTTHPRLPDGLVRDAQIALVRAINRCLASVASWGGSFGGPLHDAIVAFRETVEADARQQERDRIAAAVEALPGIAVGVSGVSVMERGAAWVPASVVLAIVKGEQP